MNKQEMDELACIAFTDRKDCDKWAKEQYMSEEYKGGKVVPTVIWVTLSGAIIMVGISDLLDRIYEWLN